MSKKILLKNVVKFKCEPTCAVYQLSMSLSTFLRKRSGEFFCMSGFLQKLPLGERQLPASTLVVVATSTYLYTGTFCTFSEFATLTLVNHKIIIAQGCIQVLIILL